MPAFPFAESFGAPPARPMPGEREVLVLACALDVDGERLAGLRATFSPREEARFQSFAHEEHRLRWGASRGFLREALGAALGLPAREIAFGYGAHGKPGLLLSQQPRGAPLRFNLSHSGGLALLVLARGAEVGADVELPRQRRTDDLARRWFTPGEQARVVGSAEAFFRLWPCKEAFLKATGEGLSRSLRSYEIELDGERARLLWAERIDDAAGRYEVFPLRPGEPYRAAAVVEAKGFTLRTFRWP